MPEFAAVCYMLTGEICLPPVFQEQTRLPSTSWSSLWPGIVLTLPRTTCLSMGSSSWYVRVFICSCVCVLWSCLLSVALAPKPGLATMTPEPPPARICAVGCRQRGRAACLECHVTFFPSVVISCLRSWCFFGELGETCV